MSAYKDLTPEALNKVSLKNKLGSCSVDFKSPTAISFISHSSIAFATFHKVFKPLTPLCSCLVIVPFQTQERFSKQFLQEALTIGLSKVIYGAG